MLDYDIDVLVDKVGGAFALSVLVKRRVQMLVKGATPLVEVKRGMEPYEIALEEISQDKVAYDGDPYAAV